jgi:hypothetical protein
MYSISTAKNELFTNRGRTDERQASLAAAHRGISLVMRRELIPELNSFEVDFTSAGNVRVDVRSKDTTATSGSPRHSRCGRLFTQVVTEIRPVDEAQPSEGSADDATTDFSQQASSGGAASVSSSMTSHSTSSQNAQALLLARLSRLLGHIFLRAGAARADEFTGAAEMSICYLLSSGPPRSRRVTPT